MGKKLNIAIFHLGFFFSGGGEKLVLEEAKLLKKRGHNVSIFAPVIDRKRCFPDIIRRFKINKLFINLPGFLPFRDFIAITGSIIITPFLFWRFIKFDVFFGANQPGPLICFILSKILKKPYVIYLAQPTRIIHPRAIDREKGFGKGSFNLFYICAWLFYPIIKKLDDISIQNAQAILTNGTYIGSIIRKIYKVKTVSCPAGCIPKKNNVNRFSGKIKVGTQTVSKPYILITNRHFPQKRFDYMVNSLPSIIKNKPDISLIITGAFTGNTSYLKKLAAKLGVSNKVCFTGLISEKNLEKLYRNTCLYVYTAPAEDFGMGVIEAMGYGIPVVAWRSGGPKTTIIDGKTGYLIKPYDLNLFKKAVLKLVSDKKLNTMMGKRAFIHAKKYSYANHLKKLEQELQNVVHINIKG